MPPVIDARPANGRIEMLWQRLAVCGPYAPLAMLLLVGLPLLSASRAALMLWQAERVAAAGAWPELLLQGLRNDLMQIGIFSVPLLLLVPLLAWRPLWGFWRRLSGLWVLLAIALLVLLEVSSPAFIAEYDSRPNRLYVEYLKYPGEVLPMLWEGFRLHLVGGVLLTAAAVWGAMRLLRPWLSMAPRWGWVRVLLTWPLVLFVALFAVRSSVDHRPANPASFALTGDPMVNTLVLNSAYSVTYAIYGMRHEARSSEVYGKMAEDEILRHVRATRELLQDPRPLLGDPEIPTLTEQPATVRRERPLNLVIILEESLGATFVESLGGVPVTPEIEKLKKDGWWFEQLYATGTRSVRGIEAVTTGFLPTPAQAVVKLSLAQRNFSSLASILGRAGYESEFIYGGESHFDNMRGFFLANGFSRVTDENDYVNPVFKASWGVSDEDLFNKTHERLLAKHGDGLPSFTLVFTSSNHSPFEFPDGRIELYEQPKGTDNNAVKYTDWALGRFIEKAKKSPYWQDTLFVVVADHDIRVRGETLVPIERFHIPGLILGADIKPRTVKTVASQIDLPPTLLSLLGVDARHPMPGRDLTREPEGLPGRAMMQYNENYAWMEGQQVVVLRPDKAPTHGRYDPARKHLDAVPPPADGVAIEQRALAHSLLPAWLYREQRYRLPEAPATAQAAR
ncbi:LTA synthase family protein [Azospira restricta]|uniref:LTA synthase family protein n=1 Tax=Azospira restricta TaxID=404405 RepID=A0A974PY80_9RHOO|nr:LTA synthase family protein [Azospira restricta]QRJ63511.1 LTA synthase family protein [Azospira restricta]